jgi:tRNA wybutosine-synthesizing protein 4
VDLGYYEDVFIEGFCPERRQLPPLMNRGHFARSLAIQTVVERFEKKKKKKFCFFDPLECRFLVESADVPKGRQVVSLGAGFDTLYFRLAHYQKELVEKVETFRYFEVDFDPVVKKKQMMLKNDERFSSLLKREEYKLFSCDLRNTNVLTQKLTDMGFDSKLPTIFLSECVLIYMSPEDGSNIISWAAQTVPESIFCTYEQIKPNDAFGKVMIRNLQARNIPLHSLMKYPSLNAQKKRYLEAGFLWSEARTMIDVYENYLDVSQTVAANRLEQFDEYEEWNLVLSHYCVVLAGSNFPVQKQINF